MPRNYESKLIRCNKSIEDLKKSLSQIKPETKTEQVIKKAFEVECHFGIEQNYDEYKCYIAELDRGARNDVYEPEIINRKQLLNQFKFEVEDESDLYQFKILQLKEFIKKYKIK